jgi:hypothetical protein
VLNQELMKKFSAYVLNVARCYPPQPEDSKYPERNFLEAPEESVFAAPTTSRVLAKRAEVDQVEDSEELGTHSPSSSDNDGAVIHATPLDSCPPTRTRMRALLKFGLDAS